MKQHENSKAHKKRLDEVEKQLLMEALLDTGGSSSGSDSDSEASAESSEDDLARSGKADLEFTEHDGESFSSDTSSQSADDSDSSSSSGDFDLAFLRRKNRAATLEGSASSSDECDELANEVEDSSNAMKSLALHDSTEIAPEDEDRLSSTENLAPRDSADQTQNSNVDEAALPSKSKVGKRKNKKVTRLDDANMSSANACKVCGAPFPSRSKLFEHIKAKGHAAVKGPS
jgi:DnaJ family protein A protein 5